MRFRASKTGLSPPVVFLLAVLRPRRFLCCNSLFVRCLFYMWCLFCHYLSPICSSFGASGRLCFEIVAFPSCLHIYYKKESTLKGKSLLLLGADALLLSKLLLRRDLLCRKANRKTQKMYLLYKEADSIPNVSSPLEEFLLRTFVIKCTYTYGECILICYLLNVSW